LNLLIAFVIQTPMNMEYMMNNNSLGTFWSPIESDSNSSFVSRDHGVTGNVLENRRKLATQLLEALDSSQKQLDEPYGAWLEEPMDLEVFGLSLVESSPLHLDETEIIPLSPESLSDPAVPFSPIQPSSPEGLYPFQEELLPVKTNEAIGAAPPQNEELLESLELLLHQFKEGDSFITPEQTGFVEEDDETIALLDSLINGDGTNNQDGNGLDEFITLIAATETDIQPSPVSDSTPDRTISSIDIKSEPSDSEWTPRSSGRKATSSRSTTNVLRKTRKKTLKTEDRRLRKKEQNKTAATRYRLKKKAELDILLDEEADLEKRNRELRIKHDELANEVRYLKKLMLELFNNRNEKRS